jgi:DivIVA domain-containing protein
MADLAPLRPWQVRGRRFRTVGWFGRRGLDPDEVHEFLNRVATDLNSLYADLARSREEMIRIKQALRRSSSATSRCHGRGITATTRSCCPTTSTQ